MMGHGLPAFSQPEVLIGRPSRSLHLCFMKWFCPSPEPGSNSGMPRHDQVVLNGTARGYAIVSRTRPATACRNHPAIVPGEPANGIRSPTSKRMTHSRPGSIRSLHLPVSPLPARWLILDSGIREDTTSVWRRVTLLSNRKPKTGRISLGNWSDSTGRRAMSSSLPDIFIC